MLSTLPPRARPWPALVLTAAVAVAAAVAAAAACYVVLLWSGPASLLGAAGAGQPRPEAAPGPSEEEDHSVVRLPESRWAAAGVRVAPAVQAPLTERVWRTGRLALNEDRVAHVAPRAEGVVREVHARLGQDVKAGDVLAVIDSREV